MNRQSKRSRRGPLCPECGSPGDVITVRPVGDTIKRWHRCLLHPDDPRHRWTSTQTNDPKRQTTGSNT